MEQREARAPIISRIGVKARLARAAVARRPFSAVAAVAAALVFVLLAQSLASGHFAPLRLGGVRNVVNNGALVNQPQQRPYAQIPTPVPGELVTTSAQFDAIAGTSPADIWIAGESNQGGPGTQNGAKPFLLHFDGSQWSLLTSPVPDPISSISMDAPDDGWAVAGSAILHYTGGAWTVFTTLPAGVAQGSYMNSISMSSRDDGWIIGTQATNGNAPAGGMLLHYSGGQWALYTRPSLALNTTLLNVSMYSPNDGWAVGSQFNADTVTGVVAHYQDGAWTQVGTFGGANFIRVAAAGPNEAWVVGVGGPTSGILVHCLDGACQQVPSPTPNILSVVSARSPSQGWIGGDGAVIFRRDGSQWTQRTPTYHQVSLTGLLIFSDLDGWAIGQSGGLSMPAGAVLFRCVNGAWQVYQLHVRVNG